MSRRALDVDARDGNTGTVTKVRRDDAVQRLFRHRNLDKEDNSISGE